MDYSQDRWELYHLAVDFSQAHDLAERYPAKLKELQEKFYSEARRNDVYPLGALLGSGGPSLVRGRKRFDYPPTLFRVPKVLQPPLGQTSFRISAHANVPDASVRGTIVKCGDRADGMAWYVKDNRLIFESQSPDGLSILTSNITLPRGQADLSITFDIDPTWKAQGEHDVARGKVRLLIGTQVVAQRTQISPTCGPPNTSMYIGRSAGSPVGRMLAQPYSLKGDLGTVSFTLD